MLLSLSGLANLCSGQAVVNEALETASVYVDAVNGNDSNNGSKTSPLKTISAGVAMALQNNWNSIGSKVIINPGTYREAVTINGGGSRTTSLPITFQAATTGTAIISGADVMTGWTVDSGNSKLYKNSWPYNFGICPAQPPPSPYQQEITLRAEMVIVNGTPLTQVLALTSMLPGTFYIDDAHAEAYIYPPSGTNMSTATVEVATRPHLLQENGQSNVVFRGLTVQYANTCHEDSAVIVDANAQNVLFDADSFVWNNGEGLMFTTAEYFTVQNSTAYHNGEVGFFSHQVKNDLWKNDITEFNNWRGAQGAFYVWDSGGAKWMWDHDGTYTNFGSFFNQGNGVAWDTDQYNVTLNGMVSSGNITNGIQIEKSEGPFVINNSYVCNNNLLGDVQRGGIVVRNSELVSVTGSTLWGNSGIQMAIVGVSGGIPINNWETGQAYNLVTKSMVTTGNAMSGTAPEIFSDSYLGGADWTTFVTTLTSNLNSYYAGSNSAWAIPAPQTGTMVDLSSWQSTTGQDLLSSWKSTSAPSKCVLSASVPDYWLTSLSYAGATVDPSGHAYFDVNAFGFGGITGNIALTYDGVSVVPGLTASYTAASIPTNGSSALVVTASPTTAPGTYPITILGNLGNITRTVTLSLTVPKTAVRLSTASLSFGQQKVGTTSAPQVVTLTNYGKTALGISSISTSGNYAQTNTCGTSVAAGKSCTISVTFTPRVVGADQGRLTIKDSDGTSPQHVPLSGTGVAAAMISIRPLSVYFGGQKIGTTGHQTVTLKNVGTATLTISNMTIGGTNSGDFKSSSGCGSSIAVGASCTVTVSFTPAAKGTRSGTLSIYDNDGYQNSPQVLPLSGTGAT
jgi:Abnormal spindle-like microcephaly-assoc'd, ASPM-SPD-2-Hydin